jgi:hypothetical protein
VYACVPKNKLLQAYHKVATDRVLNAHHTKEVLCFSLPLVHIVRYLRHLKRNAEIMCLRHVSISIFIRVLFESVCYVGKSH